MTTKMTQTRTIAGIAVIGVAYAIANFSFGPAFDVFLMFLFFLCAMLLIGLATFSAIRAAHWRKTSRFGFLPFLLSLLFLSSPLTIHALKDFLSDVTFRNSKVVYDKATQEVASKKEVLNDSFRVVDIDAKVDSVERVYASRRAGHVIIKFMLFSKGRIRGGYLFIDDPPVSLEDAKRLVAPHVQLQGVSPNWYRYSE